jgi:SAM-dependent methyltransferase
MSPGAAARGWRAGGSLESGRPPRISHGPAGIAEVGHREYVGGHWEELGRLQFDFLVARGLAPHHYLLDIGCGPLRGGRLFIAYLEPGHYLGIDKEEDLIAAGIELELGRDLLEQKRPQLLVSSEFAFERFGAAPDVALAQSVFTHLPPAHIAACLGRLQPRMAPRGALYATYYKTHVERANPDAPHDHGYFAYTRGQMQDLGRRAGWTMEYIGQWGHPRGQVMVRYVPR